ncbi:MAG: hypothetical protein ACXWXD_09905, partial [Candidatus Deferrimicrobiaceae bacterium]
KEDPVKTILTVTLAGMFLLYAAFHFRASEPLASLVSSSSQIYIHGTPVCVTQQGKDIVAKVGECGVPTHPPDSDSMERLPFRNGHPGMNLPPGHPPIDQEMFPGENRRVLI